MALGVDREAMATPEAGPVVQTIIVTVTSTILKQVRAAAGTAEKAKGAAAMARVVARAGAGAPIELASPIPIFALHRDDLPELPDFRLRLSFPYSVRVWHCAAQLHAEILEFRLPHQRQKRTAGTLELSLFL